MDTNTQEFGGEGWFQADQRKLAVRVLQRRHKVVDDRLRGRHLTIGTFQAHWGRMEGVGEEPQLGGTEREQSQRAYVPRMHTQEIPSDNQRKRGDVHGA